jgi:hypothetical protein
MWAASFTTVFTVDTAKPSPHVTADILRPHSYLRIICIFTSESMAVRLGDGSLFPLGACLSPAMVQNMKILSNN